ncbi:predicted protein [Nematostella vectensis]|uniref:Activation-induced cytidine deaminase AID domain-containing protein n=1 Tax=Nematostella vectensis TaxID=45351 RepID=A7T1Z8_NEMVE|nr:predicted protein [Nematostella vectensis]|eukprot:XP_001622116.1 predicted protein [Nematostella vectensis]
MADLDDVQDPLLDTALDSTKDEADDSVLSEIAVNDTSVDDGVEDPDHEHKKIAKAGDKVLGNKKEFCGAFYHVPRSKSGCLDKQSCAIAKRGHDATPLTAVALVKYEQQESSEWAIKSVRRYTNCSDKMKHAEEFFLMDIDCQLEARHKGEEGFLDFWNKKKWQITMYLTMQPCHLSTDTGGTKEDQSCCEVMIKAKEKLGDNVEIVIKPTHLCQVGWYKGKPREKPKNAEKGVRKLFKTTGIELECMKEGDWKYLLQYAQPEVENKLPDYDTSRRKTEDEKIGEELHNQQLEQLAPELAQLSVNEKRRK